MFELKIIRERRQGYGTLRRVRDAAQVYEAFRKEFGRLDREMVSARANHAPRVPRVDSQGCTTV